MSRKSDHPESTRSWRSWLLARVLLSLGTFVVALGIAETGFRFAEWPRFLELHRETMRFAFAEGGEGREPFYVNHPGRITFHYDGNPRGYFDAQSEVHHDVNPLGFRGPAFTQKPEGTFRLVCLGDSFTFGEGVRNEDTYPEVAARLLRKQGKQTDACNLGVGGYNTTQSLGVLERFGFDLEPDVVVLGYTINDAEPPLFQSDPSSGAPVRRVRPTAIEVESGTQRPPATALYRFRLAQAVWKVLHERNLTQQTLEYYRSVNDPSAAGCIESERALREIIATCRERGIPCIVVMFPLLYELSDAYPLGDIHERVGKVVTGAGGVFIDLLPRLTGQNPARLIVHPTDPHPNETVHALAGELVAERISSLPGGHADH